MCAGAIFKFGYTIPYIVLIQEYKWREAIDFSPLKCGLLLFCLFAVGLAQ